MTGSVSDAEDLVQETLVRALARPPANHDEPWRPWLTRVALNLARDVLRRRRRRAYVGPWLPAPLETGDDPPAHEPVLTDANGHPITTEGRYDLMESVSFGFLLALEALTPRQRAVLLLRDVFDYSVEDAAAALAMSPANVKTTHHRARRAMDDYDRARCPRSTAYTDATRDMLGQLLAAMRDDSPRSIEALLAADVRGLNDGGGEFIAARKPLVGPAKVALFYWKIGNGPTSDGAVPRLCELNGLPALVVDVPNATPSIARRFALQIELDRDGRVRRLYNVLATAKLSTLTPR
jgi:RNA polymerase sigma-70 factor (ECF subfamily)